jgi:hypothetical protein
MDYLKKGTSCFMASERPSTLVSLKQDVPFFSEARKAPPDFIV